MSSIDYLDHSFSAIDPADLCQRLDYDWGFLAELVDLFPADHAEQLTNFEAAIASNDAEEVANAAHRWKGSFAILGAERGVRLMQAVENAEPESRITAAKLSLPAIQMTVDQMHAELRQLVELHHVHGELAQ